MNNSAAGTAKPMDAKKIRDVQFVIGGASSSHASTHRCSEANETPAMKHLFRGGKMELEGGKVRWLRGGGTHGGGVEWGRVACWRGGGVYIDGGGW